MELSVVVQCNNLANHLQDFLFTAMKSPIIPELSEQHLSELLHMNSAPSENYTPLFENVHKLLDGIPPAAITSLRDYLYLDEKAWTQWVGKFQGIIKSLTDIFQRLSSKSGSEFQISMRIFHLEAKFKHLIGI